MMIFTIFCSVLFLQQVHAGTLSWENSKRLSPNSFELYLEATDLDLNYLSGTWEVTSGKITNIVMHDGWINSSGISNTFYYYRDGVKSGNYRIATITIELTSDSTTKMHNVDIGVKRCVKDSLNHFFNKSGNLVNESEYNQVCLNDDATLKSLGISHGTLTPNFQPQQEFYRATVDYEVRQVHFTPVLNHNKAHVVFGTTCQLNVGENTCQIIVEAENKTKKTYTVIVTRKNNENLPTLSSDATLKSLSMSEGILNPSFQPNVFFYSSQVANSIQEVTFYPIVNHMKAKVVSDTTCKLKEGLNQCRIIVEAENQSRQTYLIQIIRDVDTSQPNPNPSSDATLKSLSISNGVLSPTFQSNVFQYSATVLESVEFVIFSPIVNHEKAKILSGQTCALTTGVNHCSIVVEAEDKTKQTYQIDVTREKKEEEENNPYDTSIRDLSIEHGILTEIFDSSKKEYTIEITEGTEVIVFQYILNANNHQFTIPYEIDFSKPYYDLVITSLNQQKQDTYRFYIKVISSGGDSNNGNHPDSNPGDNNGVIDNPQTGEHFSFISLILLVLFTIAGIFFVSKQNIIRKL